LLFPAAGGTTLLPRRKYYVPAGLLTFAIRGDTEPHENPFIKRSLRFAKINSYPPA